MNINYFFLIKRYFSIFLIGIVVSFASCEKSEPTPKDDTEDPIISENKTVNEWVTENMRTYYYWNNEIPIDSRLNFSLEPTKFFYEEIRNEKDEFSWIQKADELNEGMQGVTTSTGMEIVLSLDQNRKVFGIIKYVIPASPADKANVKRGDIFTKVDGVELTINNYEDILKPYFSGVPFNITLATINNRIVTTTNETVSLTSTKVDEPSVHHHSIITSKGGKKVGYIFYNRFLNNKVDELYEAFNAFKAAGVSDLILDLRYNLGGGIAVSGVLSALVMDNYDNKNVFVKYEYNDLLNQQFDASGETRDERFKDLYLAFAESSLGQDPTEAEIDAAIAPIEGKVKAGNLNLSKVYVLATDNSASASELVIHNLAPYMDVIHIGGTTVGKNEGSITIEDERKPRQIEWAIQPIIVKLADKNGNGDYDTGLLPDEVVNEYDLNFLPLSPMGSKEDPLIFTALKMIDPTEATTTQAQQMSISREQTQQAAFSLVEEFNQKNIKPLPVLLDKSPINQKVVDQLKIQKESEK